MVNRTYTEQLCSNIIVTHTHTRHEVALVSVLTEFRIEPSHQAIDSSVQVDKYTKNFSTNKFIVVK